MLALKQFRHDRDIDRGLPDYLNYGHIVSPGIILCKDGSLLIGRYMRGRNLAYEHQSAWEYASEAANRALGKLGGGWAIWVDAIRLPAARVTDPADNHFPDEISTLIEAEHREILTADGLCMESDYVVVLHYTPPLKVKGAIVNLIYDKDKSDRQSAASAILEFFHRHVTEFDEHLSAATSVEPMTDRRWTSRLGKERLRSDLVNYLYFCVTGEWIDIELPPYGCYLDGIIAEKPVFPGSFPKIGDMYIACISLSGYPFPDESGEGALNALDHLPFPLRWTSRYIVLEQPEMEKQQKVIESKWKQKARGWKGILFADAKPNEDAESVAQDAADAIRRTQSMMEGTGYYTCTVTTMHGSVAVLEERVKDIRRAMRDAGYPSRLETNNAMEAWLSTLPGHCVPNVRRPPIHSTNMADLMPLSAPWQGRQHNPCPYYPEKSPPLMQAIGAGNVLVNLSFHMGDKGHAFGAGPIGSGKSTFLSTVATSALRYDGALVWAFDKGRTMMPIFRACGRYHDIGVDRMSFAPLSVLEAESDLASAEEWIATCFELQQGRKTRPTETEAIHQAMLSLRDSGMGRSVTHFIRMVQNQEVRDAMAYYALGGTAGNLTDAEEDGLEDGLVIGFEMKELLEMGERIVLPVLLHLFRRFQRSLKGQPAYLLLDEAWTMLAHPVFRDKIREWLKELRKLNCCVVMATQHLTDAVKSGILDVILDSCGFRFFGANPAAMTDGVDDEAGPRQFYRMFGLTDAQIELVRQAVPKRQYLIACEEGSALVDLRLGPKALKFVGAGSIPELKRIDALYQRHGAQWAQKWLQEDMAHA